MSEPGDGHAGATAVRRDRASIIPVALRRRPTLRWTDARGPHAVTFDARCVLGSAPGVEVHIADPTVSRLHAELELRDDGLWIRDLGSTNGTFVENVEVAAAKVPDEALIRVGATTLAVHDSSAPSEVELWPGERFGPLIGRSPAMRELFTRLARVAPTDSTVLILGETGTGKELVARAIHEASPRVERPFVIVDCAALPENLLESELFGHTRGAFTGASASRAGAFEAADGGTVFLDEIGELPLAMQPKLLRVLESRMVRRLGETAWRKIDVRVVAATHRDLRTMVNAGGLREDLYFRLAVLPVKIPPLRERPQDVPALIEHFLPQSSAALAAELCREASQRPWFGNVRELRNFVERAVALGAREAAVMAASDPRGGARPQAPGAGGPPEVQLHRPFKDLREEWLDYLERQYVAGLLAQHNGNVSAVAQAAGLDRTYVHRLIRKHDL